MLKGFIKTVMVLKGINVNAVRNSNMHTAHRLKLDITQNGLQKQPYLKISLSNFYYKYILN